MKTEILSLPIFQDSKGNINNKKAVLKYYCTMFDYNIYKIQNRIVEIDGKKCLAMNDYDDMFEFNKVDYPINIHNIVNEKYPFPIHTQIKIKEGKKVKFDLALYNELFELI